SLYTRLFCFTVPILRPPTSTFFPYTTLFRSDFEGDVLVGFAAQRFDFALRQRRPCSRHVKPAIPCKAGQQSVTKTQGWSLSAGRSEEHTSELQSRENLVCRLLLEKKKQKCRY